jgi:hypothetical protein
MTERGGCILSSNEYALASTPYDVVFFRESLPHLTAQGSVDYGALATWARYQASNRASPPRIGVYLPFEGLDFYLTLSAMRVGMSPLLLRVPLFLHMVRMKNVVTDVALPSGLLASMDQERWRIGGNLASALWVPYGELARDPPSAGAAPLVEDADGNAGFVSFAEGARSGGGFRRVGFAEEEERADAREGARVEDAIVNINSLGIRVWTIVPLTFFTNPTQDEQWREWKELNLRLARRVSHSQRTPVLVAGRARGSVEIPKDLLLVSDRRRSSWHFL